MVKIIKSISLFSESGSKYSKLCEDLDLEAAAWESKFYQRNPKKISSTSLFLSFWLCQQLGLPDLRTWSLKLGEQIEDVVSKQSLDERLNERSTALGQEVLKTALNLKIDKDQITRQKQQLATSIGIFNRILLRDSTVQKLPSHLSEKFPGGHTKGDEASAALRIQALFDFTNECWVNFDVGAYTDNDQSAACEIASYLQKRDLVLQDLGYFSLDWLEQLIENQFVITKWRPNTNMYDEQGKLLNILELMEHKKELDQAVLVGAKKRLPMRLVIRKLPKKQAQKRIEEAKKDRHSKTNHSKKYYEHLCYEIYLTNVSTDVLDTQQVAQLYGLRWHIEILFKSWKSYANFKKMLDAHRKMSYHRVLFTIYAMLIQFVYLMGVTYQVIKNQIHKRYNKKYLSVLKFIDVSFKLMTTLLYLKSIKQLYELVPQFAVHATYEKRKKRKNTIEKYLFFNEFCTDSPLS